MLLAQLVRGRWTAEPVDEALVARVDPGAFQRMLHLHGLAGLLDMRHREQLRQLPASLTDSLKKLRMHGVSNALRQAGACMEVVKGLEQAGIPTLPLKGVALSWRLYGDIGVRHSGDIDLLIDPDQVSPAVQVLTQMGYVPTFALPQSALHWRERMRSVHHVNFTHPRGAYLELHWRTDPLRGTSLPRLGALLPQLGRIKAGPLQGLRQLPMDLLQHSLASHACRSRCFRWKWGYDLMELVSARHGGASPWRADVASGQDHYTRHTLATMAVQLAVNSGQPPFSVQLTHRAAQAERREWLQHGAGKLKRRPVDGLTLHAGACAALGGWRTRLEYLGWVTTRMSPEVGERTYTLVARAPWLGPLVRLVQPLRRLLRKR